MKKLMHCVMIALLAGAVHCGVKEEVDNVIHDEKTGKPLRIQDAELKKKFFTRENPGKWKDKEGGHVPFIKKTKTGDKLYIEVEVPFESTPSHYTEFIMLADSRYNEITKIQFSQRDQVAIAQFILPLDQKGLHYIITKCNLHDMWSKEMTLK